ncbi:MAG: phosphoadenosine phosphosulfate reductase family protein [Lachnospiraceae bacterium]|nr:phosphoadenosine phosphosulfate reductase family protein [Lachnospiraceae bacterium]
MNNLFLEEMEQEAIKRIQKFARIASAMELPIAVGFSGGKDSAVVYSLCKRAGVEFTAYFNHSFESITTLKFIREHYPEVIWRRDVKEGIFQHIREVKQGLLPTVQIAYCCELYKHNPKYIDKCAILGIRKSESQKRASRAVFTAKNKTTLKKIKATVNEYFKEQCQSIGSGNLITLYPIVDWTDNDVWEYIHKHNLPINPEYQYNNRVGCIICLKTNFTHNYRALMMYPKLIDSVINSRRGNNCNWIITSDNKDYIDDKVYYVCRWLNHSFMPFTKKQEELYRQVKENYELMKKGEKL